MPVDRYRRLRRVHDTASAPNVSHAATRSATSLHVSPCDTTSTAKSGAPSHKALGQPAAREQLAPDERNVRAEYNGVPLQHAADFGAEDNARRPPVFTVTGERRRQVSSPPPVVCQSENVPD